MDNKKLLGRRIKEAVVFRFAHTSYAIKQKNISQEKLAEIVGIEPTALSNIVTGRNYSLMSTLEKILIALESDFSETFNFQHHNSNEDLKTQKQQILENNLDRIQDFYKIAKALIG